MAVMLILSGPAWTSVSTRCSCRVAPSATPTITTKTTVQTVSMGAITDTAPLSVRSSDDWANSFNTSTPKIEKHHSPSVTQREDPDNYAPNC